MSSLKSRLSEKGASKSRSNEAQQAAPKKTEGRVGKPKAAKPVMKQSTLTVKEFYAPLEQRRDDDVGLSVVGAELEFERLSRMLKSEINQLAHSPEHMLDADGWLGRVRVLFMQLRRANRDTHFTNNRLSERLAQERSRADEKHLQLQNSIHEIQHIQKEIQRCLQFKSADEDMELVTVDEFFATAPVEISKPDVTKSDEHELRLARLNWELEQRKSLMEQLAERESKISDLCDSIKERSDLISNFKPQVDSILEASRPLQSALNMNYERTAAHDQLAHLLPAPLYHLYVQANAYAQLADSNLRIRVEGDAAAARQRVHKEADASSDESGAEESESQPNVGSMEHSSQGSDSQGRSRSRTPGVKKDKRHHRSSRYNKSSGKKSPTKSARSETNLAEMAAAEQLFAPEPMWLQIELCVADLPDAITLRFQYVSELQAVFVLPQANLAVSDWLLSNLCIDGCIWDAGTQLVSSVAQHKLLYSKLDLSSVETKLGAPFGWAQKMCGLKHNPPKENQEAHGCDFVKKVLSAVMHRVHNRIQLGAQLRQLERLCIPPPDEDDPMADSAKLTSFQAVELSKFTRSDAAAELHRSAGGAEHKYMCYVARLSCVDYSVDAHILVPACYPARIATFALHSEAATEELQKKLQALQDTLNTFENTGTEDVLSAQVRVLATGLPSTLV